MSVTEPDFEGRIGRTVADSEPSWPAASARRGEVPNVVMVVLDDTGFAHLGCYGSTIETPNVDRLAANGILHTGFHSTALCSPTRACLLTGRNHHSVGMRGVSNWNTGFPNMRGAITPRAATIAEVLRDRGYATYAAGKWHLAPMDECSAAGPHTNWPLQKGFDRFYGFLQGEADQFAPELTEDNHHVLPPATPDDGYHVSEDLVDHSIGWIRDLVSVRPDRPFFLYVAFGATHAPHQAPAPYLDKYRGRFDAGWDEVRDEWFARQQAQGVVPPGTTLAPRNPGVEPWADVPATRQSFACRLQEAFAAMLDHTDAQIGRLADYLAEAGLLDDTLLVVLSDNGASQEGGPNGVMDEFSFFNGWPEDIDEIVAHRLDDIGGPHSHSNYPWGWAQVGNTPLRWYKQNTYGGGVRDPLVVHWPNGITARGEIRGQFCHAVDVAASVLDVGAATMPETVGGVEQIPLHGASLRPIWDDSEAPARRVQYFEQMGHRGVFVDGWKATTFHRRNKPYDDDEWALYHLDDDFSECHDLRDAHPQRLRELIDTWWVEAGDKGVLPLDDRTIELFGTDARSESPHNRESYVYYPPIAHIPSDPSPRLGGRSWRIVAEVGVGADGCEGVIYARGSHNVGHSFFVADGELQFEYNALGTRYRARGPAPLAAGDHELEASFRRTGQGGMLSVAVDGTEVGSIEIARAVRMLGSTGTDLGADRLSPVTDDYQAPFPFTGELRRVTFRALSRADVADQEAEARAELAKE